MPRMDGMEATRAIRALPAPAGQIPIIALTANADPDAVQTYLACGMQAVVDKPIKPQQLLTTLQWVLCDPDAAPLHRAVA
jgi:CheY-like chemotaxis protein